MHWAEEIRRIRDEKGLSDAKMAADFGVSKQYLSFLLTEAREPSRQFKVIVWSRLKRKLDLETLLSFLSDAQHAELFKIHLSSKESKNNIAPPDWIQVLQLYRDKRNFNNIALAKEFNVSQSLVSQIFSGHTKCTWNIKMHIWKNEQYKLTIKTLLQLFLTDIQAELIEIEKHLPA